MQHIGALQAGSKSQWEACLVLDISYLFNLSVLQFVLLQKKKKDKIQVLAFVEFDTSKEVCEDPPLSPFAMQGRLLFFFWSY